MYKIQNYILRKKHDALFYRRETRPQEEFPYGKEEAVELIELGNSAVMGINQFDLIVIISEPILKLLTSIYRILF